MRDISLIGPWVRRFLMEHIIGERNLALNTQRSYRDTLRLLLPAIVRRTRKSIDRLTVTDISADRVRQFLNDLEEKRGCTIATRNQRLAAIHALAKFIGLHAPELIEWCGQVRAVPFKKAPRALITYLEKPEMDALLAAPDLATAQGRRDHVLLLFLYNAGARADEAAQLLISDLSLTHVPDRDTASVLIRGKGNKCRQCPLWPQTIQELATLVQGRDPSEHVFLNRCGRPITRFGIHSLVERTAGRASKQMPSLTKKRVSPHTIRHTTATHLLRSGVDINTIRAWLGHVSLTTTNVYAEVDLQTKAKALASCEVKGKKNGKPWKENKGLMEFLRSL
ncbi:Tyrosine recombinase XerC [Gimesia alba]|uniref:Tyrosine recombinase XerC n=1 Tax=Gimesia alba TaxID=2527973 RepID=A0A517RMT8_9PLAN|nr:tyrosine-type recombinase/integrase [Gimesia alba]QDT45189.1 Tyrosine recombinase XerC [Gimesia alba]